MRLVNEVSRQGAAAPQGSASGIAGAKRHALLKASTALVGLSLLTAGAAGALLWPAPPALADGGRGSGGFILGGVDQAEAAGGDGGNSSPVLEGGGGGGAGVIGGAGGTGRGGAGGNGGQTPGANGGAGDPGGGGGGGGAHGSVGAVLPGTASIGGTGGNGGNAGGGHVDGGGGGAGGYGAVVTGSGTLGALATEARGGAGGNGGAAIDSSGFRGNGGSGGIGLLLTNAAGASLTIDAAVQGGNGGAAGLGDGSAANPQGAGGAGLVGQNLSITLGATGAIGGGLNGDGVTRANALQLSGNSSLSITAGVAAITGGIGVSGTLTLDQSNGVNTTIAAAINGTGAIEVLGPGRITLAGANTHTGGTTISAGTLQIGAGGTTGSLAGGVTNNGTLAFNRTDTVTFAGAISGTGALRQEGSGTTILTANNSYSGGTTLAGGTLAIAADAAIGATSGAIAFAGGTLRFDAGFNLAATRAISIAAAGGAIDTNGHTTTIAQGITGAGALRVSGAGGLVLTGASTFTGGTTIDAGARLQLGDGGTTGSLAGNVTNNGTFAFDRSDTVAFAGAISGTGALRQEGSGTTILTGDATHSGGTTIAAGTLRIGDGGTTGSLAGNVVNNGTLVFDRSDSVTFAGAISGTGAVEFFSSGGSVVLTGANTFTGGTMIAGDTRLQIGAGGTAGSLAGNVTNFGTLAFNRSDTVTFAGAISGFGALRQEGSGTTILTGTNSYSGGTTLAGGTLAIAADAAIGATSSALAFDGGTLRFDAGFNLATTRAISIAAAGGTIDTNGHTTTIAQGIAGAGGLRVSGTGGGTLVLAGTNSYSGGTTLAGGTLAIAADAAIGATSGPIAFAGGTLRFDAGFNLATTRAISIAAAGGTIDTNGHTTTIAQGITGTGGLRVSGAGGLVLTGGSTFTGGTTIDAGARLQLGDGGTTGSIAGNVVNNGTLAFNRADTVTFAGAISGTGAVRLEGAGTVVLTGANTFTGGLIVANGTLRIGDGGSIAGTVTNNTTTVFAQSGRVSFDAFSGAGSLRQEGSGTTELTGISSYTGATAVNAGTLVVNGSIATSSGVLVASGGSIGGNATLPSTTIASGGTISPGNSPGTITVQGNLTLNAGSLYIAEVQGAVADRINVTGTASLAGTVRLVPLGGTYTFSSPYTLLSAQGGRSGTFTTVETAGSFGDGVTSAVTYTATDVLLTLTPKPLTPIIDNPTTGPRLNLGSPANARAVAGGIDRAVAAGADPSGLFAIYNLPAAAIPGAVNQLSGEAHTAVPAIAVAAADQFLAAMLDPRAAGRLLGAAAPGLANKAADASRYAVWANVFGGTGHADGSAGQGSARRDLDDAHVAVGADIRLDAGTVAGFALAFGSARSTLTGSLGKAEGEVFQAGLYGMTRLGPVSIGAALGYARIENDVSRAVPALGGALSASYATDAWSGRLQAGAAVFEQGGLTLSPLLALQATRVSSPNIREAGRGSAGAAALAIAGRDDVTSRGEIGVQLDYAGLFGEAALSGHLRAGWAHYFQRDAGLSAAIAGLPGSGFAIAGARGPRNAALLSAGIEASITPAVTISARFDSEIAGSAARYGGTAQIRYGF